MHISRLMVVASIFVLGGLRAGMAQDKGEELYSKNCKKCHADDGSGKKDGAPLKVASTLKLKDPELLNVLRDEAVKVSDEDMQKVILKGKEKMKGLEDKITADDAKVLVQYVRTLQSKKK